MAMKKYVAKTKEEADYISNYDPTKYLSLIHI